MSVGGTSQGNNPAAMPRPAVTQLNPSTTPASPKIDSDVEKFAQSEKILDNRQADNKQIQQKQATATGDNFVANKQTNTTDPTKTFVASQLVNPEILRKEQQKYAERIGGSENTLEEESLDPLQQATKQPASNTAATAIGVGQVQDPQQKKQELEKRLAKVNQNQNVSSRKGWPEYEEVIAGLIDSGEETKLKAAEEHLQQLEKIPVRENSGAQTTDRLIEEQIPVTMARGLISGPDAEKALNNAIAALPGNAGFSKDQLIIRLANNEASALKIPPSPNKITEAAQKSPAEYIRSLVGGSIAPWDQDRVLQSV